MSRSAQRPQGTDLVSGLTGRDPVFVKTTGPVKIAEGREAEILGSAYKSQHPLDLSTLFRWEFVRSVERFADKIPEERSALLREVKTLQRRLGVDS